MGLSKATSTFRQGLQADRRPKWMEMCILRQTKQSQLFNVDTKKLCHRGTGAEKIILSF